MDYRDRFAVCAHCGAEFQEPSGRCPVCGKDPHATRRSAFFGWIGTLLPLSVVVLLMLLHRS